MSLAKVPTFKMHDDDSRYDGVELKTVERWKESKLSGDEWRFSFVALLSRKGYVLRRVGGQNMMALIQAVGAIRDQGNSGDDPELLKGAPDFNEYCFQPGCMRLADIEYQIIDEWCRRCGEKGTPYDWKDYRRRFCNGHKERGDCSLEDNDNNYTLVRVRTEDGWQDVEPVK